MKLEEINEEIRQIEGFDCLFVSEYGNLYRYDKKKDNYSLRATQPDSKGRYIIAKISYNSKIYHFLMHRLVAKAFYDGYFEGAVVNHIDANPQNNYYKNLEWVTNTENVHKMYETSGIGPKRNYKMYKLFEKINKDENKYHGEFSSGRELEEYIKNNKLNTAITSLLKYRASRNFFIEVSDKK